MITKLILLFFLTLHWKGLSESTQIISSVDASKMKYRIKLQKFQECAALRSQHKPLETFECLQDLKLDTDPYWNIMVLNGLHSLTKEEDQITEAVKILQHLDNAVKSGKVNGGLSWTQMKEVFDSEGSGSGDHHDYDYDPYDYYSDDEDDGSGSGSGSGSGEGEGEGQYTFPIHHGARGGGQALDDFIKVWKKLVTTGRDGSIGVPEAPNEPCRSPFVEIAYKMCILPVLDRQLSWDAAQEYCRTKGSTLAMDPVVVKGRRYLNDLLGESGTRERWTIWVGGKKAANNEWYWTDRLKVPDFMWNKGQPRAYSSYSVPSGTCMALDGFAEYYGTAIPCHVRRRFVCQKHQ